MSDLFLIAHKVRGEPAFDIAARCDDMGTPSDPGPWWIIPTSGARAYPYQNIPLEHITTYYGGGDTPVLHVIGDMPSNIPDHYELKKPVMAKPSPRPVTPLEDLA